MHIKKTKRSTLAEQAAFQIEQLIENGQWNVGEKIPPEPELMAQLDVSRNTLREAIRSLVHAGLLESRQGIGTTVKSTSGLGIALEKKIKKSDLLETLEVRLAFEREAAQLAAKRREAKDLERMKSCLEDCKSASQQNDPFHFTDMDITFHKAVVQATHNQMFIELYDHITDSLQQSVYELMRRHSASYENQIHSDLFQAIELGDAQLAAASVNGYMSKVKESLHAMIED